MHTVPCRGADRVVCTCRCFGIVVQLVDQPYHVALYPKMVPGVYYRELVQSIVFVLTGVMYQCVYSITREDEPTMLAERSSARELQA